MWFRIATDRPAAIVILAALIVSACASSGGGGSASAAPSASNPTGGGSSGSRPSSSTTTGAGDCSAAGSDPAEAIRSAERAYLAAPSFHAEMTTDDGNGTATAMTLEYVSPDRYRVVFGEGSSATETVQIGSSYWIKANGQWTKGAGVDMTQVIGAARQMVDAAKIDDASFIGTETVDGEPANVYHYVFDMSAGSSVAKADGRMWVRLADCWPARLEGDSTTTFGVTHYVQKIGHYGAVTIDEPV